MRVATRGEDCQPAGDDFDESGVRVAVYESGMDVGHRLTVG